VDAELTELEAALTQGLQVDLAPEDGILAFERHQLLAIRFHRVSRLSGPTKLGEGARWRLFFSEYFPRGDEHAQPLWTQWRVPLLKDDAPGEGVVISHGQPDPHWQMVLPQPRRLFINLESMWSDYEASVARFIDACQSSASHRDRALKRWRRWNVQMVSYVEPHRFGMGPASAAASVSWSTTTARRINPR